MRDLTTIANVVRDPQRERAWADANGWRERPDPRLFGMFWSQRLSIIASNGDGWDHVSVAGARQCPTWEQMERVKRLFFHDHESAFQLHVQPTDHINCHPYCLHLWRPHDQAIPMPPAWMVA